MENMIPLPYVPPAEVVPYRVLPERVRAAYGAVAVIGGATESVQHIVARAVCVDREHGA